MHSVPYTDWMGCGSRMKIDFSVAGLMRSRRRREDVDPGDGGQKDSWERMGIQGIQD